MLTISKSSWVLLTVLLKRVWSLENVLLNSRESSLPPLVLTICSLPWLKLSLYAGPQLFIANFCPAFCLFTWMKTSCLFCFVFLTHTVCLTNGIKSSTGLMFEANCIKKNNQFSLKSRSITLSLRRGSSVQTVEKHSVCGVNLLCVHHPGSDSPPPPMLFFTQSLNNLHHVAPVFTLRVCSEDSAAWKALDSEGWGTVLSGQSQVSLPSRLLSACQSPAQLMFE